MQEATRTRHHFLWQTRVQCLEHLWRVIAKHCLQGLAQSLLLFDGEHAFSRVIQSYDTTLLVDNDDRILHVLENSLIRQWCELDNLFADDQPHIDRQHRRENNRYVGNRIRTESHVVGCRRR